MEKVVVHETALQRIEDTGPAGPYFARELRQMAADTKDMGACSCDQVLQFVDVDEEGSAEYIPELILRVRSARG